MTPVARLDPHLAPAGAAEQSLRDAVVKKFPVLAVFYAAVAKQSGNTEATEKGAFYRYVRGGSLPPTRLRIYADLLGIKQATIARPEPPTAPVSGNSRLADPVLAKLAGAVEKLELTVEALETRVATLEQRRGRTGGQLSTRSR